MKATGVESIDGWRCPHCKLNVGLSEAEAHVNGHEPVCVSCRLEMLVVLCLRVWKQNLENTPNASV